MTSNLSFFEASLAKTKRLIIVAEKQGRPQVVSALMGAIAELEKEIKLCKDAR